METTEQRLEDQISMDRCDTSIENTYKEKFENLKEICQNLYREVLSNKIRGEGVNTLRTCLQEEREDNQKCRLQLKKCEGIVLLYKKKLEESGKSVSSEGEAEPAGSQNDNLAPGTSKQLLDNLARENVIIQQSLKAVLGDPKKMEQLSMKVEELESENWEQQQRINAILEENKSLRTVMESSPLDKDSKIARLQKKIDFLEKNRENQDEVCQSLSEESDAQKQQLKELAEMCHQMAKKLEENGAKSPNVAAETMDPSLATPVTSEVDKVNQDFASLHVQNTDLKSEVDRQSTQVKELLETNNRWEKYNKERELYMHNLQEKLKEQEHKLKQLSSRPALSENQQQDIDRILQGYKKKVAAAEEEKIKIEEENRHLRMDFQRQQQGMSALQRQVETLSAQVAAAPQYSARPGAGQCQEDQDRIHLLETQIQICTEDFQQERHDRENAQSHIVELEQEMDLIKRQLEQFQVSHMTRLHNQRIAALTNHRNEYQYFQAGAGNRMIARGMVEADCDDDLGGDDEDIVDSLPSPIGPPVSAQGTGIPIGPRVVPDDTLQCPKCRSDFPANSHKEFLEHIDECCI